jgi:endonuclease YncB( thermonuclease family)
VYGLKTDFNKLKNMGLRVKNFNVIYCKKLKKKYIPNQVKLTDKSKKSEFKNKNVIGIILDKYVILDNIASEKYGRILADVYIGDIHLNNLLLKERYAVKYDGGTKIKPSSWLKYKITGEL